VTSDLAPTEPTIATAEDVDCGEVREPRSKPAVQAAHDPLGGLVLDPELRAVLERARPRPRVAEYIGDPAQALEAASQARRAVPDPGCS